MPFILPTIKDSNQHHCIVCLFTGRVVKVIRVVEVIGSPRVTFAWGVSGVVGVFTLAHRPSGGVYERGSTVRSTENARIWGFQGSRYPRLCATGAEIRHKQSHSPCTPPYLRNYGLLAHQRKSGVLGLRVYKASLVGDLPPILSGKSHSRGDSTPPSLFSLFSL